MMIPQPTNESHRTAANLAEVEADSGVASWMVFQLAVHIRRIRSRRELFRVSERDLDRMGLTRFDVGN